jgi:hypothetical protein
MQRRKHSHIAVLSLGLALSTGGCGDDSGDGGFLSTAGTTTASSSGGFDETGDSSAGEAGGGDDGADTGGDGGGMLDIAEPPPPPEEEEEGDFRVPKASGRFVYSANEVTDRLAVIDSADLSIEVVSVARGPSWIEAIATPNPDAGAVAVMSPGEDEVTLVRTADTGVTDITLGDIAEGTNAMDSSPDARWALAYHDVDLPSDPVGSDQEITLIDTQNDDQATWLTVGAHPRSVHWSPDSTRLYVVSDDGVNVVDLTATELDDKPPLTAVGPGLDPDTIEIHVSATQGQAIARVQDQPWLLVVDLETGESTQIDLPAYPTDLDVSADGSFAIAMLPRKAGSSLVEVPLPVAGPLDFVETSLGDEYLGVSSIAPDGNTMLLYTTVDPWALDGEEAPLGDPRQRMTIARRDGGTWDNQYTMFTEVPIRAVGMAPDSVNAILLHDAATSLNSAAPWPYTLLDISSVFPVRKVQMVQAKPTAVLFTPDGSRAALSIRDEDGTIKRADIVDLGSFIVEQLTLGSPPQGLGYVEATDKIFISQEHGSGAITFVSADGSVATATGFELNSEVKD